ncbi:hypothetical protein TNIN_489031 [Trichonephila inaurata madagascariensis]|uniref:Uncharacterized protein n=1 Tax=Trichonephila inaurata madagascariensis TaxID=2747483 RepID=A0A8X7BX56_9ARAC|nr:hypothetical protein TNIN_489031 [Trichonephila inaurata madagascariensis]
MLGRASAQQRYVLQTSSGPILCAGNDTSRKYRFFNTPSPPMLAFQHFSSPLGALTCTLRLRTSRDVRGTFRLPHSIPFTEQKGGVNPVRERAKTLMPALALGAFATPHTGIPDAVEDVRGLPQTHTLNPFTEQRKGVNPVRERAKTLMPEVAYIVKVAPVSGCVWR